MKIEIDLPTLKCWLELYKLYYGDLHGPYKEELKILQQDFLLLGGYMWVLCVC